jgi:hypothetical protein
VGCLERHLINKAIEDHQAGKLTRWEFLQRLAIIAGGSALGLALLGDLACGSSAAQPLTEPTATLAPPDIPNILLIVIDTLRSDHLSSYGYERSTSSTIDRLAEQGVLFENTFSTAPYTTPSHASLLAVTPMNMEPSGSLIVPFSMTAIRPCPKPSKLEVTAPLPSRPTGSGSPGSKA